MFDLGVNRLSIGIQTFDNILLKKLGRLHTKQQSFDAVINAYKLGFSNISIDLMYEIPFLSFKSWKETISNAVSLPITHLSLYNLIFEEKTRFKRREKLLKPHLPHEEKTSQMLNYALKTFKNAGLARYELSAFCKNNQISYHNIGYWTHRSYLGLGPSACSFIDKVRFQNVCNIKKYIDQIKKKTLPISFKESLSPIRSLHEKIAIGLRVLNGIQIEKWPLETIKVLNKLKNIGLLALDRNRIKLTKKGLMFYDSVAEEIII